MERLTIQATRRSVTGKKVKKLRATGFTPAVLYGRSLKEPIPVAMERTELSKLLRKSSYSSLITVNVEGEEHNTLVRDFQIDRLRGDLTHVDFLVVSLTEKVRAEVRVILEGRAPAVVTAGGLLVPGLERIAVESLPNDLPEHFVVDVSNLVEFGDAIFVRDLAVTENVTILSDMDGLIVVAAAPVTEIVEEVAAVAEVVPGAEGAVAAEGVAEGEAAAPGATPAAGAAPAAAAAPAPVAAPSAPPAKEKGKKGRVDKEKGKGGRGR
ncbi:MAG TPA: 50S ribosomal protein L25 [Anaerolineales bacterium]|nr:50S ribosomal protein L25 [Anaerolineales bacterium]HLE73222.1 50S ribosomal protein L25 [Anaerolineales bacterium]